jgi:hypothetical protein
MGPGCETLEDVEKATVSPAFTAAVLALVPAARG